MAQIWIVSQSSGSYDDHREWPVVSFSTKESAQAWVDLNQPLFLAQKTKQAEEARAFDEEYDKLNDLSGTQWEEAYQELVDSWGDKAQDEPYEEWGYSLNPQPIPFYSHD